MTKQLGKHMVHDEYGPMTSLGLFQFILLASSLVQLNQLIKALAIICKIMYKWSSRTTRSNEAKLNGMLIKSNNKQVAIHGYLMHACTFTISLGPITIMLYFCLVLALLLCLIEVSWPSSLSQNRYMLINQFNKQA